MNTAVPHLSPAAIPDVQRLEELLSAPTDALAATLARIEGDILVLGVGGKMGPSLARMAQRIFHGTGGARRVIGVSRFSDGELEMQLRAHQIETIREDL